MLTGHREAVDDVTFSPDGRRVMSAGSDGTIRIWSVADGARAERVLTGHRGAVNTAVFSTDGRAGAERGPGRHDPRLATVRRERDRAAGHHGPVTSAAFDPRGDRIAAHGLDGTCGSGIRRSVARRS